MLVGLEVIVGTNGISSVEELEIRDVDVAEGVLMGASVADIVEFRVLLGTVVGSVTSVAEELVEEGTLEGGTSDVGMPVELEVVLSGGVLVVTEPDGT